MRTGIDKDGKVVEIDESIPGVTYFCKLCKSPLTRRMGEIKAHHFAHKKGSSCDTWSYEDNEWIEAWKSLFDKNVIEIPTGTKDKHFIDVKYDDTIMMFFSSLNIKSPSYEKRSEFYHDNAKRVIWVFDCCANPIFYYENYRFNFRLDYKMSVDKGNYIANFFFKHAGRVLKQVLDDVSENNLVFLHINDHFMIQLTRKLYSSSEGVRFEGLILPIASFFNLIQFKDELRSNKSISDVFKDFSTNRAKAYDLSKLKGYISAYGEEGKVRYNALLNKYKNNEIDSSELLRTMKKAKLPSEEEPYFIGGEYSDIFEKILIDKIEEAKRIEEAHKREAEERRRFMEEAKIRAQRERQQRIQAEQLAREQAKIEEVKRLESLKAEGWQFCYRIILPSGILWYVIKNKNNEQKKVDLNQAVTLLDWNYDQEEKEMKTLLNEWKNGFDETVYKMPKSRNKDSFSYVTYDGTFFDVKKYSEEGYIIYYPDTEEPIKRKDTRRFYILKNAREARELYFKLYFMIKHWKKYKVYVPSLDNVYIPEFLREKLRSEIG